jgi:predicted metalloprotease
MARRFVLALVVVLTMMAPSMARAQSMSDLIYAELDAWWATAFAERGLPYSSPRLKLVDAPGTDFCGFLDTFATPAGYCDPSNTITISTGFIGPDSLIALLPFISHEWGHHVQLLTGGEEFATVESELQADCFAGAFVAHAADSDLISPAISAMALQLLQSLGDVWWVAPYEESIHGNQSERAIAFLAGQNGGLEACGF